MSRTFRALRLPGALAAVWLLIGAVDAVGTWIEAGLWTPIGLHGTARAQRQPAPHHARSR